LDRHEAVALIKELIGLNLVQPHFISLRENSHAKYDLVVVGNCSSLVLKNFLAQKNLAIKDDSNKGFCVIFKP
jgi:hypothetical protein